MTGIRLPYKLTAFLVAQAMNRERTIMRSALRLLIPACMTFEGRKPKGQSAFEPWAGGALIYPTIHPLRARRTIFGEGQLGLTLFLDLTVLRGNLGHEIG